MDPAAAFSRIPGALVGSARRHLRSQTAVSQFEGLAAHLKTSDTNLALEADVLSRIQECKTPGARPVRLLKYEPSDNVLITEYVAGNSLFNELWNATSIPAYFSFRRRSCHGLVIESASWLRGFHAATGLRLDPPAATRALDWVMTTAEQRMVAIRTSRRPVLSDADLQAIGAFMRRQFDAADRDRVQVCGIHGDYCPTNMIVDDTSAVVVLDFADTRTGLALEDVARLWSSIWEMGHCGIVRAHVFRSVLPAIVSAASATLDEPAFRLLRAWNAVTRIHQYATVGHKLPYSTRQILKRLAAVNVQWLVRPDDGTIAVTSHVGH